MLEIPLEPLTYSIVIPAYSESARIAASLNRILAHAARNNWKAEIIVVDDGSKDTTADIVRDYWSKGPWRRIGWRRRHARARRRDDAGPKAVVVGIRTQR